MTECLIIGGGAIGLSLAWQLALRGRRVRVLDRQEVGREASWAGAGILPPANRLALSHPFDQLRGLSFELHREWAKTLHTETGIDIGYRRCGGIYLGRSAGEAAALSAWAASLDEEGVAVERLLLSPNSSAANSTRSRPRLLSELEPQITSAANQHFPAVRSAWFLPDECQLRNPRYLKALQHICEQQGVEIIPKCEVHDFELSAGKISAVVTSAGRMTADQICVTSGAWTGLILQKLGVTLGVAPIRGQMVLFRCERPLVNSVINEGSRYLVPRGDGRLLAGATEEEAGFDKRTTDAGIADLISFALSLLPALQSAEIERCWAGLRPASFDGFPYLGTIPGLTNAFVAAGHFRSGLYLSPGTAILMAQLICGEPTDIDLLPFRVGR